MRASEALKYANPRQLGTGPGGAFRGIPKYTQRNITGVAAAAVQKIQAQERCSMYHPSNKVAMLLTNTMSAAYAAMPKIISRLGSVVKTKVSVSEENVPDE